MERQKKLQIWKRLEGAIATVERAMYSRDRIMAWSKALYYGPAE